MVAHLRSVGVFISNGKCFIMDELKPFFQFLHKFTDLSHEEFERYIQPYVQVRRFNRRETITRAGEVEDYLNFILVGAVRKFFRKGQEELNTQISTEGHIIHVQESFHSRTPSEYYMEAIEPTRLASITFEHLEGIYATNPKMEHLGRLVITFTMILRDKWQTQLVKLTPRERFLRFVQRNPELLQRVPQKYLASYLNIQPETFSRFKHLLRDARTSKE